MQTENCGLEVNADSVLKQPATSGSVSDERLAIIVIAIDVSNFTSSGGFGVDILFQGKNEKRKCLNMQFTAS